MGASSDVVAAAVRIAGRLNASSISPAEISVLMREHQLLAQKVVEGSISRPEQNRLDYVRWSLERIEDAKYGEGLDVVEKNVAGYERVARDLRTLQKQLLEALNGKSNKRRKQRKS
jgi:hypothetical protein